MKWKTKLKTQHKRNNKNTIENGSRKLKLKWGETSKNQTTENTNTKHKSKKETNNTNKSYNGKKNSKTNQMNNAQHEN